MLNCLLKQMNERIKYLLQQYVNRSTTVVEERELAAWALAAENREALQLLLTNLWDQTLPEEDLDAEKAKEFFQKIVHRNRKKAPVLVWKRLIVAASVIALIGLGIYFYTTVSKKNIPPTIAKGTPADIPAPATNRAMITLADGSKVYLDSVGNGQLVRLGNIELVKLANGQIAYQTADGQVLKEIQYNTLTNPKGSKAINITLADGSQVWLNAESSITYPIAFVGNERKVELKGEGYFEVAKDASKKFIVTANGITTEVLGTHFNINSYRDGKTVDITLLEGSVKVNSLNLASSRVIKPGQQARVAEQIDVLSADINQVMAWKEEKFDFGQGTDIHIVMNQLARWYDFEVEYEKGVKASVGGKISRNKDRKKVLELLEKTGSVRFKFNQSKVIVMSP